MVIEKILGSWAMFVSLLVIFLGLTSQVLKNRRLKKCEGLSFGLILLTFITYFSWALYAWSKPDWFLAASQTSGTFISTILLAQYFKYERPWERLWKKEKATPS